MMEKSPLQLAIQAILDGTTNSPPLKRCLPSRLWHYSKACGAKSIVESQELWATRWDALNDTSELRHGLRFLKHAVRRHQSIVGLEKLPCIVEKQLFSDNDAWLGWHIASLTEAGDDLGQWRAYGDNGRGNAIAFDAHRLGKWVGEKLGGFLTPVNYCVQDQRRVMLEVARQVALSLPCNGKSGECGTCLQAWAREIGFLLPVLKHPAYSGEKEWRIIIPLNKGHTFTAPDSNLNRISLELGNYGMNTLITSIHKGPAFRRKDACWDERWVRRLTDMSVRIRSSNIPWRITTEEDCL